MRDIGREQEDRAFWDHDILKLAVDYDLERHIAFDLVEELLIGVDMVVLSFVWTSDHEDVKIGVFPNFLVADGWF